MKECMAGLCVKGVVNTVSVGSEDQGYWSNLICEVVNTQDDDGVGFSEPS